jgi:asparagine synthase (glutamine-hydrolysing)
LTGVLASTGASCTDLGAAIGRMTSRLRHRGPDGEGVWIGEGVALGHRRLAILDLSPAGAQPMHSACGRYVLVFNGEIYNHLDLRHALGSSGGAPVWRGHSDTETLLAGFAHWGVETTLRRTAGMFALALWDRAARRLVLARDRMGEKPLYWGWAGSALVFGSELKALRQHPGFPTEVCRLALAQYLQFSYVPAPRSIHPGVYKLEPGCLLEVDGAPPGAPPQSPLRPGERHGSLAIRRYWSLTEVVERGHQSPFARAPEAIAALESTLGAAVERQLLSDVPLGALLSGGIDSTLIVALMQQRSSLPVRTFTVGNESAILNEAPFAAAVARHLGTEHVEVCVTDREAREVIPSLPDLYDEPFADSSQIPTHLVCRIAREHVTVALSGDGGDELFGGYNRYFWGPRVWSRVRWMPRPVRNGLGHLIGSVSVERWDRFGSLLGRLSPVARPGDKAHKLAARLQTVSTLDDLYRSLVAEWPGAGMVRGVGREPDSVLDDPLPSCLAHEPVSRMMVQDMRSYLPDDILCKVDRAAMGVSLETRVPFLDPSVVEVAARVPLHMKVRDGQGKWILRELLYRHVPRALIDRPKAGFAVPIGAWLRGPLRPWAEELLSTDALARDGLIDPVPVARAWMEHLSGRRDWTVRLWIVLMLQAWRVGVA